MQLEQLVQVLRNSLSGDPAALKSSLEQLNKLSEVEGGTGLLLQAIAHRPELDLRIRQAAAIRAKNLVVDAWTVREGDRSLSERDRQMFHDHLVGVIVGEPASVVRNQLLEILFEVSKHDFPERWPNLVKQVSEHVNSGQPLRIYCALQALRFIFKSMRYRSNKSPVRWRLLEVVLPTLKKMGAALLEQNSPQAYMMLYEIAKILLMSTGMSLPPFLTENKEQLDQFYQLVCCIAVKANPEDLPEDEREFSKHPLIKAKKWAVKLLFRHFSRFGLPGNASKKDKKFAMAWYRSYAQRVTQLFLDLLDQRVQKGLKMHRVTLKCIFTYITDACKAKELWAMINKRLRLVLIDSVFQVVQFSRNDLEMWQENPQQYFRAQDDLDEQFKDARLAALGMLNQLVKTRTKTCLPKILQAITDSLNRYARLAAADRLQLPAVLAEDATFQILCALRPRLQTQEQFRIPMTQLVVQHALPLFGSENSLLRYRACCTLKSFCTLEFGEKEVAFVMNSIIKCLHDKEVTVKLAAALALQDWLDLQQDVEEYVYPHVPTILRQFFKLFDELGSDEVVGTLSQLCSVLGPRIAPFAVKMVTSLTQDGLELLSDERSEELGEDAFQVLQNIIRCLVSIFMSMSCMPEAYPTLERLTYPLVTQALKKVLELWPESFELVGAAAMFSKPISPQTWAFFPIFIKMLESGEAAEFWDKLLMTFDSFIANGIDTFLLPENGFCRQFVGYLFKVLRDREADLGGTYAVILLGTIMAHAPGRVDALVQEIIPVVVDALMNTQMERLKMLCLDTLGIALHYNASLFVQTCARAGPNAFGKLLWVWTQALPKTKGVLRHQRLALLGLMSLFEMAPQQLQQAGIPLDALTAVFQQCTQVAAQVIQDHKDEDDDEADPGKAFLDVADDADDFAEEEDEEAAEEHLRQRLAEGDFDLDLEEPADPDEHNFRSPLDDVDELTRYCDALRSLQQNQPQVFKHLMESLPEALRDAPNVIKQEAIEHQQRLREEKAERDRQRQEELQVVQQAMQQGANSPPNSPPGNRSGSQPNSPAFR